jgi:hypothetical protein
MSLEMVTMLFASRDATCATSVETDESSDDTIGAEVTCVYGPSFDVGAPSSTCDAITPPTNPAINENNAMSTASRSAPPRERCET